MSVLLFIAFYVWSLPKFRKPWLPVLQLSLKSAAPKGQSCLHSQPCGRYPDW